MGCFLRSSSVALRDKNHSVSRSETDLRSQITATNATGFYRTLTVSQWLTPSRNLTAAPSTEAQGGCPPKATWLGNTGAALQMPPGATCPLAPACVGLQAAPRVSASVGLGGAENMLF